MISEAGAQQPRTVELGARFYKHPFPCDRFCYKPRLDGLILIILTYKIDIYETVKFTHGLGHKAKVQGQIYNFTKLLFWL